QDPEPTTDVSYVNLYGRLLIHEADPPARFQTCPESAPRRSMMSALRATGGDFEHRSRLQGAKPDAERSIRRTTGRPIGPLSAAHRCLCRSASTARGVR